MDVVSDFDYTGYGALVIVFYFCIGLPPYCQLLTENSTTCQYADGDIFDESYESGLGFKNEKFIKEMLLYQLSLTEEDLEIRPIQKNYLSKYGFNSRIPDLFIKMDDDDVYKADYVKNIITFFEKNSDVDIVSSEIKFQLNGTEVYLVNAKDLGGNVDVEYRMPMTYAFNKKALNAIINLEKKDMFGCDDMTWRIIWKAYKLKHAIVDNSQEVIWHIHGKNVSTSSFLK